MPTELRAFEPNDLTAIGRIHEESATSPTVDRAATQPQETDGDEVLHRVVIEEAGEVLGYAYVARSAWHPSGEYQSEVFVRPSERRRGVGSRLASHALAWAQQRHAVSLTTWVSGQCPECEAFATGQGFEVVQRFVTMTLDVAKASDELLSALVSRARQNGIALFSFDEVGDSLQSRQKLYHLNRRLAPLLPGNGEDFPSFEDYQREIIEADWFSPEGQLIAADGEHWIGLVGLGFYEEDRRLHHEFTALDPAYQGRGIALALKAWSIQKAKAWGVREIRTGNDASNTAILRVNRRLGYREAPGVVKLRRRLGEVSG